tara:strand:+ start:801 stop:1553 length:753 start_codon:yes stop_codon:yes gene_type:complete
MNIIRTFGYFIKICKIINYLILYGLFDKFLRKSIVLSFRNFLSKKSNIERIEIEKVTNWKNKKIILQNLSLAGGNASRLEILIIASLASSLNENENVLEIGTFDGKTTINCANNIKNSRVYTLDLPENENGKMLDRKEEYLEYDKSLINSKIRSNKKFEKFNNIEQIYADSTIYDFSKINFSLAFIDGGHDYNTVKSDTENCMKHIKKPGIILWHDYDVTNPVGIYLRSISKDIKIYWIDNTRMCISYIN